MTTWTRTATFQCSGMVSIADDPLYVVHVVHKVIALQCKATRIIKDLRSSVSLNPTAQSSPMRTGETTGLRPYKRS